MRGEGRGERGEEMMARAREIAVSSKISSFPISLVAPAFPSSTFPALTSNASPSFSVAIARAIPSFLASSSLNPSTLSHSMQHIVLTILIGLLLSS